MSIIRSTKTSTSSASITRRSFITALSAGLAMVGCASKSSDSTESTSTTSTEGSNPNDLTALALDQAAWSHDADNDLYYQIGVPYCTAPAATDYESMGIYVPGSYFTATDNGDGTYTCEVNASGAAGAYTAATAPIVMPVNTAGYSAQAAPSEYSAQGITDYTSAGLIYVYAGCRGRDNGENADGTSFAGGAPWGVTDLKAAIRCLRLNDAALPGNKDHIFTFGHSGGGAQSALVGATGDSSLYTPYLEQIGAAFTAEDGAQLSDAICGAMCWCPITSLDMADAAYEWMMGQFASSGTREEGTWTALLSEDLAKSFVSTINTIGLTDADGARLTLSEGGEGVYTAGSYYDHLMGVIEESLNNFLADTTFPYTPSSDMGGVPGGGATGGPSGGEPPSGEKPSGAPGGDSSDSSSGGAPSGAPSGGPSGAPSDGPSGDASTDDDSSAATGGPSGGLPGSSSDDSSESTTYEDAQAYIDSLNADEEWVSYDASTNTASITSLGAFVRHCKKPTKDVSAFDSIDRSSSENKLFGNSENDTLHFDKTVAKLLENNADRYAEGEGWDDSYVSDYATELEAVDDLGTDSLTRQNMYNPLYYLSDAFEGFSASVPARHWRIRTGIEQGDTSLTTEVNLALALAARSDVADVDFATVWEQGHTTAERTGSSTENFLAWIESCR